MKVSLELIFDSQSENDWQILNGQTPLAVIPFKSIESQQLIVDNFTPDEHFEGIIGISEMLELGYIVDGELNEGLHEAMKQEIKHLENK